MNVTGSNTIDHDFEELSESDLQKGELQFGLPAALIILLVVFGAVVAGLVPLMLAIVSIIVALGLMALVGQQFQLSFFVVNMLTGMGLALGIDYALFVVSRFREERARGRESRRDRAHRCHREPRGPLQRQRVRARDARPAARPDTIIRSLGAGAILVGIVSVVAALTLLPAVLSLLGDRVNALRHPVHRPDMEREGARRAGSGARSSAA